MARTSTEPTLDTDDVSVGGPDRSAFVGRLSSLYEADGPFASVYLPLPAPSEDSDHEVELAWRHARSELADAGAPDAVLEELDDAVDDRDRAGGTLCLVTNGRGDSLAVTMPTTAATAVAAWDRLPRLVPLITWHQSMVPHVVVITDRTGADLTSVSFDHVHRSEQVDGETFHIQRSAPGGWSQRRFQQRAENRWDDNARAVADEVAALAEGVGAELIVVAGDVRAKQFLTEHLPDRWTALVQEVDGGRNDWSLDEIAAAAARLEATVAAEHTVATLERFREARGHDMATTSVSATLSALGERRVDTLLVVDDLAVRPRAAGDRSGADRPGDDGAPAAPERAAFGIDDPAIVATDADRVTDTGQDAEDAPLVDAAVAAALAGGADVRVVPSHAVPARLCSIARFSNTP